MSIPEKCLEQDGMRVAKRRVSVQVQLSNGLRHEGHLYVDQYCRNGNPATVIDRLNDPLEDYLPLATEDTHILINKDALVTVELDADEVNMPDVEGTSRLRMHLLLSNGVTVAGEIHAVLSPAHSRVLDYLNSTSDRYIALNADGGSILVNRKRILSATEPERSVWGGS